MNYENSRLLTAVIEILREREIFEKAAEYYTQRFEQLKRESPPGPKGGVSPAVKDAALIKKKIEQHGPEGLSNIIIPVFYQAAERWQQITDPDVAPSRPYLRYGGEFCKDHRTGHGTILTAQAPFWKIWYPPNSTECQCCVTTVSESLLRRRGWAISELIKKNEHPAPGYDFNIGDLAQKKLSRAKLSWVQKIFGRPKI